MEFSNSFINKWANGYSQPFTGIHFTMSVENCAQVAANQLEFDMYLQFDGTTANTLYKKK